MQLIEFSIQNFRGIVSLQAAPNGQSLTLRGKNGSGKSSAIDALWWGLGGQIDGEVVRNGAEHAEVEIKFGAYLVTRRQSEGKRPALTVKSADGKVKYNSPTALLAEFVGAIERQTFSHKRPSEQAQILRQLAPEIDTTKLDQEAKEIYAKRTEENRVYKAQIERAAGVVIPVSPETIPDDIDLVDIANRKSQAEKVKGENARIRADFERAKTANQRANTAFIQAQHALDMAKTILDACHNEAMALKQLAERLQEPDTSQIDQDIATARTVNADRARMRHVAAESQRARSHKLDFEKQARLASEESAKLTKRLEAIVIEKSAQLSRANIPVEGLMVVDDTVMVNQPSGPVELAALNTGARMRLDVEIAAALGHKLVAVRDASLLDDPAELVQYAASRGVQLISEVVQKGEPLSVEIVEKPNGEMPTVERFRSQPRDLPKHILDAIKATNDNPEPPDDDNEIPF